VLSGNAKANLGVPGRSAGPAAFLSGKWSSLRGAVHGFVNSASKVLRPGRLQYAKESCAAELHGLLDLLNRVCKKILANTFLRGWLRWWSWILIGFIVVAAFRSGLAGTLVTAAALAGLGAVAIFVWLWRMRPSAYDAALQVDRVAGLKDRISTALYFGTKTNPEGLVLSQRRDALQRLPKADLSELMSLHLPVTARRTLVLTLAAIAFLTYRMYYQPPMMELLQATANSHLVQSILSPVARVSEKDVQRAAQKAEAQPDAERRAGEAPQAGDDPWKQPDQERQADDAEQGNFAPEQQDPSLGQTADSVNSAPSLSKSVVDALKDMLSSGQQPPQNPGDQPPGDQQGQPRNSEQKQPGQGDEQKGAQDGPDAKENSAQNASGAGDQQPGTKERVKNEPMKVKAVPERVALESKELKEQPKIKATAGVGSAQIVTTNITPKAAAAVNGAEQPDIPARYRSYVQQYFVHQATDAPQPVEEPAPASAPQQ
jgi:hypothetical protein